jgi:hypothetical protein
VWADRQEVSTVCGVRGGRERPCHQFVLVLALHSGPELF